ncbi:MAG TPA: ABC transporter substrate-binding protein [Ilumatobacter sp.]|nr:ABC transporter substrate-binding protein [Ilumatobacter sp.]
MKKTNRSAKAIAFVAAASLIVAACGDDDDGDTTATTAEADTATTMAEEEEEGTETTEAEGTETTEAEETETTEAEETETTEAEAGEAGGMTVTYPLSEAATWNDGSAITAADFECTWQARVNTPGSITTVGYDLITGVEEGASASEVVVTFGEKFAAWKTLFSLMLQSSQHDDCADVSTDFTGSYTYGAGPYVMTEWTAEQAVFEKNAGYVGENTGGPERVVFVPAGITELKSGTVDFIYPQAYTGIDTELADPNITFDAEPGGQFEALYFMLDPNCTPDETRSCAFADPAYREAFSKSIDLEGVYEQIYAPFAQGVPLLECGPIAPGPYCDPVFTDTFDPEGAATVLTDAGWTQDGSGMWVNADGEVPEVHFMVNTPNPRREGTQEFLIPKMAELGFNVVADNCEAVPCVFQTRLPAQKFDMGMYISTVAPDPGYIASTYVCGQIPSEENDFQGQNSSGWCNEEADAALVASDSELDEAARADLVKLAISKMAEDFVLLPTLQFPNIGAYRTDKVAGTQSNLANYWAFNDWYNFEDLDGDGQVVLGAEQFPVPDCANPITECANSSWFQWVAGFTNFPGIYLPTNDQTFVPGEFLSGEATVTEL